MHGTQRLLVFDSIRKSLAAVILSFICFIFSKVQMPVKISSGVANILRIRNKVIEARIVTPTDFAGHRPSLNLGSKVIGRFYRTFLQQY